MTDNNNSYLPDSRIRKTFNWELVRGFGQSKLGAVSIAMPFIGFALLYHEEMISILGDLGENFFKLNDVENENKGLSLIVKLNLLYLGSFFVGLGSIVYRLMAPKTIKEFSSISNFTESEISRTTARKMRSMMVTIKSRRPAISKGFLSRAPWLSRKHCTLKTASNELRGLRDDQLQNDILSSFYNVESRYTATKSLWLVVVLYGLGFFLLSVPGIAFTYRVLKTIFFQ